MQNTLYTQDNLFVLHGMNSRSVDLIYLDPPFNSKRMYSAPIGSKSAGASFKDMWTWQDVNESYLDKLVERYPALVSFIQSVQDIHSRAMMAYITYMTQRIIEMHRVLKDTGSLYLHCDPTAGHYLKIVLDEVFGKDNFRNEIIWQRMLGAKGSQFKAKKYDAHFDLSYTVRHMTEEERARKFPLEDEDGRRYYDDSAHIWCNPSMGDRPNLCYEWRGFINPHPSGWRLSKKRLEEEYQKGNIIIKPNGKLERRKYEEDYFGGGINNVWSDIRIASGKESTGYPTQKPLALLHRIVQASSQPGDTVFDPFCGCATTCVAAQQLGRRWIGIDIERKAAQVLIERLSTDAGLFSDFIHRTDAPQRTDIKPEPITPGVKERLFKTQEGRCNACGTEFDIRHFEVDHIIPKAKGGGDYYENYQLLCGNCNRIKGDRPMEYLRMKIKSREEMMKHRLTFALAVRAGNFARDKFLHLSDLKIEYKGVQNLVSEADKDTEKLIRCEIAERFPNDAIMGEEYGLERQDKDSGYIWIIDPIDGTNCFLNGMPSWCVSIALAKGDKLVCGAVYDPNAGELFFAEAGKGAFINHKPVKPRPDVSLTNTFFAMGYKIGVSRQNVLTKMEAIMNLNGNIYRNGSGALMTVYAGCSRVAGFYEEHINSWDAAAGYLFAVEAGAYTSNYYTPDTLLNGNSILICPPHLADEIKRILNWQD
ncbi:hypothetical protein CHS0354_035280 [Potamilus streckersoni]|uniref:HNH nuclease domain-containing protein n=1 Tax=Potamilus streckersoni TaxID=2493646 RepID=A0AAE0S2X8_9BIVA|nr:hypothetical protein CHS0354_035280 [Potamilus streckersoni]